MTERPTALLTFDTELHWGLFFLPEFADREAEMAEVRPVLERLLAILDERALPATFAVVGRLFRADGVVGEGPLHPDLDPDWAARAEAESLAHPEAWFGRDLVESILASSGDHEIGGHGYAHLDFDRLDRRGAEEDVAATVAAAAEAGVAIRSWVYPRNRVAHEEVLGGHGIVALREAPAARARPLRFLDQMRGGGTLTGRPRPVGATVRLPAGVPILPGDGLRRLLTRGRRRRLVRRGVERALRRGETFHLWAHPHNFVRRRESMLAALADAADEIATARDREGLEVTTMGRLADRVLAEGGR